MEDKILDSVAIEKLRNHSKKLFSLKHALRSYFECIEGVAETSDVGIISLGVILLEYFEAAKAEFDDVQKYLDIAK